MALAASMAVLLAMALAAAAQANPRSYNTPAVVSPTDAPWSVLLIAEGTFGNLHETDQCSGSIVDASHVLTASHCVHRGLNGDAWSPDAFTITAGISSVRSDADLSGEQQRKVVSVQIHPGWNASLVLDDVALLTLSAPFHVGGAAVAPVLVAGQSGRPVPRTPVREVGWGDVAEDQADGREHVLDQQVVRPYLCSAIRPSLLCAVSPTSGACGGDSGSGLIVPGSPAKLVGVLSGTTFNPIRQSECSAGTRSMYTDLASPEIAQWLAGSATPPSAPRALVGPSFGPSSGRGRPLTCGPPDWSGSPALTTDIVDSATGTIVQSGPMTYRPTVADRHRQLVCVSIATNAGGTTEAASDEQEIADPHLKVRVNAFGNVSATDDAGTLTLRLYIVNAAGRTVRSWRFRDDQAAPRIRGVLPGHYRACLASDAYAEYSPGRACVPYMQRGSATRLVRVRRRWFHAGRWHVRLALPSQLAGRWLTVAWGVARCRRCAPHRIRTVKVRGRRRLLLTAPATNRWLILRLRVPQIRIAKIPYDGGARAVRLPPRR